MSAKEAIRMSRELFHFVKEGSQEGFTLNGKNLLLLEQIICFKSELHFESPMSAKEAIRKSRDLFHLVKAGAQEGLLLKERICSFWSKFFSLRVNPTLGAALCQLKKQSGRQVSCFP